MVGAQAAWEEEHVTGAANTGAGLEGGVFPEAEKQAHPRQEGPCGQGSVMRLKKHFDFHEGLA